MAYLDNSGVTTLVKSIAGKTKTLVAAKVDKSVVGKANGVASLDSTGHVPSSQLPSYVDDVLEFEKLASFPKTGEGGKIYVALDTNLTYRWSGTAYIEISKSLAVGTVAGTAYDGAKGAALESKVNTMNGTLNTVKTTTETNRKVLSSLPGDALKKIADDMGYFYAWTKDVESITCEVGTTSKLIEIGVPILAFNGTADRETITIPNATTTSPGIMSKEDKVVLDNLKTFQGNVGSTYLTKTDASNTYLTKTAASSTYQTKMSAIDSTTLASLIDTAWNSATV